MITNSHNLEASLLRFPHLGASTRRVIVHAEDLRSRGDELNAETVAVRSLGIVLLCCPRLVALEIESFNTSASFVLAELAACRQPKLEELSISDVMAGSEEEGRFVKLLDSLPCLRKLDVFSLPLDADGSPAQDDASRALTSSLTSLNVVGLYSNEVIHALPLRFASALTTLTFSISEDPDLGSPDLDRFTNLRSLAFDLPEPSNIVPVLELIEQLSDLPRLESLRVGMQGPWSANLHIDWSGLPTTLTTISLVTVDLCWSSIAKLLASPGRETCKISWSEINWSKENQSKMEKLVGKEDPLRQRYVLESGRLVLLEVSSSLGVSSMRDFADLIYLVALQ